MELIPKAEAKAKGLKRYFTGKACIRGEIAERYVINNACACCSCQAHRKQLRKPRGSEKARVYYKKWAKAHPEYAKVYSKKWRLQNPEKARAKARRQRKLYPEKKAASNRLRRAKQAACAIEDVTPEMLHDLLQSQEGRCAECSRSLATKRHLDHINPLTLGGPHAIENLQYLCPPCNLLKGRKNPLRWAIERGRLPLILAMLSGVLPCR